MGEIDACRNTGMEFVKIYRARHNGPFRLPPSEIESGGFFTIAQVAHWIAARPQDFAKAFLTLKGNVSLKEGLIQKGIKNIERFHIDKMMRAYLELQGVKHD